MSEKDPSKNVSSSVNQSKWDEMADFEKRLKAFREAQEAAKAAKTSNTVVSNGKNTPKVDTPKEYDLLTPEEIKALLYGLPEDQHQNNPADDNHVATDEKAESVAKAQADELAKAQADELAKAQADELAKAKELENQQNFDKLQDLIQEKNRLENQGDTGNSVEGLALAKELENQQDFDKLTELIREMDRLKNQGNHENTIQELSELDTAKKTERLDNFKKRLSKLDEEIAMEERHSRPLTAINANWTHDRGEKAHDLAEQTLNAETEKGNIITKIWKGTLFKKYYEKKYEREFLNDNRTNKDGKTLTEIIKEESPDVIERFVLRAVENEERYLHGDEKLEKLDEKTNAKIKHAIEKYARIKLKKGEKVTDDLDRRFENDINSILANTADAGHTNNYLEVAKEAAERYKEVAENAKGKAEHEKAMALVMAGFQAYHADVRSNVRTEAHRDNLDKIVNWFESSKIGKFIPAEIVAGAAGAAMALTQTGIKAIFGVIGGIAGSSIITGLKERNRITEDRARMLRDIASGKDYDSKNKKISKHEQRIGGTLYDMKSASELTDRLKAAMYPENGKVNRRNLLSAIAEARVHIDFSDAKRKDLISYSSDYNRGKERLNLDIALIRAERSLSKKDQKTLEIMKKDIEKEIKEGVEYKDEEFKKYRRYAAIKKAGKSLVLGSAIFLGSQEIMAAIDPNKIGIFEKAGIIKTENAKEAKETLLASGFGMFKGSYEVPSNPTEIRVSASNPKIIKQYEANGYKKLMMAKDKWEETVSELKPVDPSASTARVDVKYDGWASRGGLTTNLENGKFVSTIKGAATINGRSVNYTPDQVKAFITIGDSKFEIANEPGQQLTWGDNGVFTTTTGETIKAIGDNGEKLYKYFEIAAVNNVDGNGVQHIIPLATDVGKNTFSGKIEQLIETTVEHPAVYTFVKKIPGNSETIVRGLDLNGFAFAPETARTGLGEAVEPPISEPTLREQFNTVPEENIEQIPEQEVRVDVDLESPEFATWEADIKNEIANSEDLIGAEGVAALTDSGDLNDERRATWNKWWDNLSEEGKNRIKELVNRIHNSSYAYSPNLNFSNAFLTWYMLNS